jgi:hypothetical protein
MVRVGAWWLQDWCGKENLSFLTCTLPDEALEWMSITGLAPQLWAEIVRQFEQWLKRRLKREGLLEFIVGVTEVQESRWKKSGKVGLHLHWAFQGRANRKSAWAIKKEEFAEAWLRIVSNVIDRKVESKSATRVERVKKSIENYLAKYMTKGGKVIQDIVEAGKIDLLPSSWWNVSNELKRIIKRSIRQISEEAKNTLYDCREQLKAQGIIQWFYVHEIEYIEPHGEARKVPVALIGKFKKPEFADMFIY